MSRILSLFIGMWQRTLRKWELRNPEAIYDRAIEKHIRKREELIRAVAPLLMEAARQEQELLNDEMRIRELDPLINQTLSEGEDALAEELQRELDELTIRKESLQIEFEKTGQRARKMKDQILAYETDVKALRRRKAEKIADLRVIQAEARVQSVFDGLTLEPDLQALTQLEESMGSLSVDVAMRKELSGTRLDEKIRGLRNRAKVKEVHLRLEERKRTLGLLPQSKNDVGN